MSERGCGLGVEDLDGQKEFMDSIMWTAKSTGLHIHIIHHVRKGRTEVDAPDLFDVRGAGQLLDMPDNICIVHRNRLKEEMTANGSPMNGNPPDARITVKKQRHGEWEGPIKLWYHESGQFLQHPDARPAYVEID